MRPAALSTPTLRYSEGADRSAERIRAFGVPQTRRGKASSAFRHRTGFTLMEMLVVIGIIILIVAMAIPAIRSLTGTRSLDAGYNTVSALVTRAREEAVGLQTVHGVLFYLNPSNDRVEAAIVQETAPPNFAGPAPANQPTYYLDLVPDHDYLPLPPGVGVQCVNNGTFSAATVRSSDGYIGLNPTAGLALSTAPTVGGGGPASTEGVLYGGVILFDGNGRLISKTYGFKMFDNTVTTNATGLAKLLKVDTPTTPTTDLVPVMNGLPLSSQFGFVLFDREAFKTQSFTDGDTGMDSAVAAYGAASTPAASPPTEADEEAWLDKNSAPILINRYNGTLIRAE